MDQKNERFYNEIDPVLKTTKNADKTILLGDFNPKVKKEKVGGYFEESSLGDGSAGRN